MLVLREDFMGQVGFGSYRISKRSNEHKRALMEALKSGCPVIDTSSNYTNGESESLIGEILSENPNFKPLIITKAGYIQGQGIVNLKELHASKLGLEDLVDISSTLKHSIHPEFLMNQITQSLMRLKVEKIDYFLLHNPEYFFEQDSTLFDTSSSEYYRRIEKAFNYLEEEVKMGRIGAYGISSNNFVLPLNDPKVTDLNKILEIVKKNHLLHFKMIQFPFNLIEIGALEKLGEYGDHSLLELAIEHDIKTVINRPLNAFTNNRLVRLASYEANFKDLDEKKAQEHFDFCLNLLHEKWNEGVDEITTSDDFHQIELISQLKNLWNTLATPDAVDQVYMGHVFPFIAKIWGRDLSSTEAAPFFKLLEFSEIYSRKNMTIKALEFKRQAQDVGLLPEASDRPFATMAIETYLDYGFDYVLVGMKNPEYVDQLKHLF